MSQSSLYLVLTTRGWVPSRTFMFPTNHDTLGLTHGNCWQRPGLSLITTLYKYRLDCDTGDSCPAWPRPRHHNNNYTARTIQTTHNCYTALIWLMTGTGGQTGATLSLWVLWVFCECCHPPDDHGAWHPGVLSWEESESGLMTMWWTGCCLQPDMIRRMRHCDIDFVRG